MEQHGEMIQTIVKTRELAAIFIGLYLLTTKINWYNHKQVKTFQFQK